MKALLVYPEWPDTYWSFKHALPFEGKRSAYPPLGLMTIAPLLPRHWQKRLVDTNVHKLTDAHLDWADVVLLSGMLVQKKPMLDILDRCRRRGLKTVVGGPITSSVEDMHRFADHVVIGESEEMIAGVAAEIDAGSAKPVYRALALPSLQQTPLPDVSLINPRYYSGMAIQYSRGCPFNCEFCDIIEIYGRVPRTKLPSQVVAELDLLYEARWRGSVFIVDDNFIGNKRKVKELLPALADWNARRGRPFTFFTEASINLADDAALLQMMKDAGFTRVFLGIETPEEDSLKQAQKMQNTRRSLLESVRRIRQYGMEVMAGFIVGFDNDPEDIFDKQVRFIEESAIPLAMVGLLQAVPGTQLYRRLMREGRILHEGFGDNMDFRLNFIPKMNADRLIEGYRSILQRIYGAEAYYERVRRFLADYHPVHRQERRFSDYVAFCRSVLKQGVLSRDRAAYWKFLLDAATRYRHAFDTAMTLAVMGYHFQTLTRLSCGTD
jgi:radical SAM superfamily enzyme YgiQ (UPF0313 family)